MAWFAAVVALIPTAAVPADEPLPARAHHVPLELIHQEVSIDVVEAPLHLQPDDPITYLVVDVVLRNRSGYRLRSWFVKVDAISHDSGLVHSFRVNGDTLGPHEEVTFTRRLNLGAASEGGHRCTGPDGQITCEVALEHPAWAWGEPVPAAADGPTSGLLAPALVEHAVGSNPCVQQCLVDYREAGGDHIGKVWLQFEVEPHGGINDVQIITDIEHPELIEPCIQECLADLWFDPFPGGEPKQIKYPFVLGPVPAN